MSIKDELSKLNKIDIWSLMLFVLYKFQSIPEYSSISELAYVLDEKNLLKLCEYFGGQTIRVPTIDELENTLYAMLLYQYTHIEHIELEEATQILRLSNDKLKTVKSCYVSLQKILKEYELTSRRPL